MVKHELGVTSYKLLVTSAKLKSMNLNSKVRVQIHELQVQIHELRVQIQEFQKHYSIETQVNSLKISSFPNILSLKSFGNSWGNSRFNLVIILCFTFPLFHGYGFSRETKWVNINFERRDLTSTQKSHSVPDDLNVQLRTYLIDGPFFNRKKIYKDIRISHALKYKHSKK